MTPADFARDIAALAAAHDLDSWRIAEIAHCAEESGVPGWADQMAREFERGKRWAQLMAQVGEIAAEWPVLRKLRYTKAVALFPYLLKLPQMSRADGGRLMEIAKTFAREWTLERLRMELRDAFGKPETPADLPRKWGRWSAELFSHAETLAASDPRRKHIETAARELQKVSKSRTRARTGS